MGEIHAETVYFEAPGSANTARTLELTGARMQERGIGTVVVATTTGATGRAAAEMFAGRLVVVVSHVAGFRAPGATELLPEHCQAIDAAGGRILTTTHAFGGIGRAVRRKLGTYETDEIVAYTLRVFGEGMKVALEVAGMAADAGLIPMDEEIVAVGGTGSGADTAVIVRPAHVMDFFDARIVEIICKPRLGLPR